MAQKSIGDLVVDRLHEMRHLVRDEFETRYKKIRPFREKKLSDKENLKVYDSLDVEDRQLLRDEFGEDGWAEYQQDMNTLRSKVYGR